MASIMSGGISLAFSISGTERSAVRMRLVAQRAEFGYVRDKEELI